MRSQGSLDCTARRAPSSNFMTGASASITRPGKTPARRQSSASSNIATRDQPSVPRASAAAVEHGAGAQEQQALEERVIEHVEDGRGQRKGGRGLQPARLEGEREPEPDEDDSDVLDRVIGEQALEVMLHERVEHAEEGGDSC